MKRRDLEKHLRDLGCSLLSHGGNHDRWMNPATGGRTALPRHTEIKKGLVVVICVQRGVPPPAFK